MGHKEIKLIWVSSVEQIQLKIKPHVGYLRYKNFPRGTSSKLVIKEIQKLFEPDHTIDLIDLKKLKKIKSCGRGFSIEPKEIGAE